MSGVGTTQPAGNQVEKETCWYFSSEQLANSPSRRCGIDSDGELSLRQMTAYLIQEMGQRLQVSQLCINTAIVYMHRFYAFHSFTHFHRNTIAAASLFLAAKVEEQPRKLEHVIKAANKCLNQPTSNTTDPHYQEQAQDLVFNENVLLQTLGFDVAIDHPHTHVVKTCQLVKACKDLAQTSYFLASNSLHLTSMCLQYKPTVVACFCIYLACKWSRWEIPQSTEGKHWFHYVDKSVTMDLLKQLTDEFIAIYEKSPSRLKSKLNSIRALAQGAGNRVISKDKKAQEDWKMGDMMKMYHSNIITNDNSNSSTPHSTPYSVTNDPMPAQNPLPTLPPPPPQQLRKSEMHTSQSRSHHSSSNAGSHHHSKLAFAAGETETHKGTHKQPHQSSRGRDHTQATQNHASIISPSTGSARSLSNGRSSMSGSLIGQPPTRQSTGGSNHQMDLSYHKSRERATASAVASAAHSATVTTHKAPKHDSNRQGKDSMNRVTEQTKASNKMFPQGNMYAGQQMPNVAQSNSNPKVDSMTDIQRSLISNQQRAYATNSQQQQLLLPTNAYPILQPQNSAPRLGNSGTKYDQSKTMSVHLQQQQTQPQPLQKQLVPPSDAQYGGDLQQHPQQTHYGNVRSTSDMLLGIDEHLGPQFTTSTTTHNAMSETVVQQLPSKPTSIFSPDWDDNKTQNPLLSSYSSAAMNSATNESFGYKFTASSSTKDSPKKTEREREPSTRKEKNRLSRSTTDLSNPVPHTQSQQPKVPTLKVPKMEKLEPTVTVTANMSELAGTSMGVGAGSKRPNELSSFKQEDEMMRTKVRKLDVLIPGAYPDPLKAAQSAEMKLPAGIETNPDLVSSLLKGSLCPSSALLQPVQPAPPAQNINPPKVSYEPPTLLVPVVPPAAIEVEAQVSSVSKSEKKKKKEKHKHKEKDKDKDKDKDKEKSKDREERKKHKKDKDKHKERERDAEPVPHNEPAVKIKISKEKLEAAAKAAAAERSGEFKIKIPKERITAPSAPPPALKIKISKDRLENYTSGPSTSSAVSSHLSAVAGPTMTNYYTATAYAAQNNPTGVTLNSGSSSSGRKRDRDKEKKRSSDGSRSSSSKSAPKIHHMTNNMSQLFGEFNDDDDDDDVYQTYQEYTKSKQLQNASSSSATASSSQSHVRQNFDYGSRNVQSQQQTQQHFSQPSAQHQLQQR